MRLQGEPYFHHPERVAANATELGFPDFVVAAAYLHDVIEDCEVSWSDLFTLLEDTVTCDLVLEVTNVAKPTDGNRATRMAINRLHLAKSTMWGASLKCLDIRDNLTSIFYDRVWAAKYFAEKEMELKVLAHADIRAWTLAHGAWDKGPTVLEPLLK